MGLFDQMALSALVIMAALMIAAFMLPKTTILIAVWRSDWLVGGGLKVCVYTLHVWTGSSYQELSYRFLIFGSLGRNNDYTIVDKEYV